MTKDEHVEALENARATVVHWENECTLLEDELQDALEECQKAYRAVDYILEAANG